jgi:hypothetical protein
MQNLIKSAEVKMGEKVQLKGGICEVNFVYNVKKEVYPNSSLDIPKLSAIVANVRKGGMP